VTHEPGAVLNWAGRGEEKALLLLGAAYFLRVSVMFPGFFKGFE
jgi:hypothetical protein